MSASNKNPFTSFANAYFGFVTDQLSDLSTKFDNLVSQSSVLFDELAVRGEAVEADLKNARRLTVSNPMKNLFDKLSFGSAKRDQQLDQLSGKVDGLIEVVAQLAEQKAAEKKKAASEKAKVAETAAAPKKAATTSRKTKSSSKAGTTATKTTPKTSSETKKPAPRKARTTAKKTTSTAAKKTKTPTKSTASKKDAE